MTRPIDLVLSRAESHGLRQNGNERWRMIGTCHGGKTPGAVSIGIGHDDAVLLKCWNGCSVDQVAGALGLELSDLFPPRPSPGYGGEPIKRRRLLTAGQALDLLDSEILLTIVCASDMARGEPLDEETRDRLLKSAARVAMLREEVHA